MKTRLGDQPLPIVTELPFVQDAVIADIEARKVVGIERYGTPLQPFNGRDVLQDLYEELLDAAMYVKQAMIERDNDSMRQQIEALRDERAAPYHPKGGVPHSRQQGEINAFNMVLRMWPVGGGNGA